MSGCLCLGIWGLAATWAVGFLPAPLPFPHACSDLLPGVRCGVVAPRQQQKFCRPPVPTPGLLGKDVYQTEGCRPSLGSRLAAAGGWDSAQKRAFPWLTAMCRRMLGAQTRHMGPKSLISLIELSFLLNERRLSEAGCRDGSCVGLCGSWGAEHPGPFSGLFLRGASARGLPVRGVRATPSTPRRGQPRGAGASAPHSPPRALLPWKCWPSTYSLQKLPGAMTIGRMSVPITCCHQSLALRVGRWSWLQKQAPLF